MGTTAARHAYTIIQNVRHVLAIEAFCAAQAVEYRGVDKMAPKTRAKWVEIRAVVPSLVRDRFMGDDLANIRRLLTP